MALPHERPVQSLAMDVGRPSPHTNPSQVISSRGTASGPPHLVILTLNINSWYPFKQRWSEEGTPREIESATVLLIQEHKLTSLEQCDDAVEWCSRMGWKALFRQAEQLPSGKASGGVAILVADRTDIGITDPTLRAAGAEHRLLAVRLVAPGLEPTLLVSAYLQAGGGLNQLNRTLLSTLAQWQETAQAPILVGGIST